MAKQCPWCGIVGEEDYSDFEGSGYLAWTYRCGSKKVSRVDTPLTRTHRRTNLCRKLEIRQLKSQRSTGEPPLCRSELLQSARRALGFLNDDADYWDDAYRRFTAETGMIVPGLGDDPDHGRVSRVRTWDAWIQGERREVIVALRAAVDAASAEELA